MTRVAATVAAVTVALVGAPESSPSALSSDDRPPLARVAQELARYGANSAFVYVWDQGREVGAAVGVAPPRTRKQRFRVGSVTKTFTATVVLRLAEEGRVELDDPLGRYLPGIVPRGNRITVRQLLNHTSGLANYTDYTSWLAQAEHSTSTHPLDVLRFAASRRPVFTRPGSRWSYSNTNYIALGLIIENVTGSSFRNALERYVIRPLDLRHTELARRRLLPGLLDSGANPNLPWAAGGLVSNAHDLARFYSALLTGDLLSVASLTEMRRTVRTTGPDPYGLRLRSIRHSCGSAWGHGGTILDYGTVVEATSDGRRVAVVVTRGKSDRNPDMGALLCS